MITYDYSLNIYAAEIRKTDHSKNNECFTQQAEDVFVR